jgi:hypothetical protein
VRNGLRFNFSTQDFGLQQTVAVSQVCSNLRVASFPTPLTTSVVLQEGQTWAVYTVDFTPPRAARSVAIRVSVLHFIA